jgi:hypothetical protein
MCRKISIKSKEVGDIRQTLRKVLGLSSMMNWRTYGIIYGFMEDGFSHGNFAIMWMNAVSNLSHRDVAKRKLWAPRTSAST